MINSPFDIIVAKVKVREGAKPLRSKKKRLRKKWNKKNLIVTESTTYRNCTITGMEENFND